MRSILSFAVVALSAAAAPAQNAVNTQQAAGDNVFRVSNLMGSQVYLSQQDLGKIVDIVLNADGCTEFLVVALGNDELVAIPWGAVNYSWQQQYFTITNTSITQNQLRQYAFARNSYPNFASSAWLGRMRGAWGAGAFRQGQGTAGRGERVNTHETGDTASPRNNPRNKQGNQPDDSTGTSQTNPNQSERPNRQTNPQQQQNQQQQPNQNQQQVPQQQQTTGQRPPVSTGVQPQQRQVPQPGGAVNPQRQTPQPQQPQRP